MIGIIRSGIIFKGKNRSETDAADRAPGEVTEIDDEIRRDPPCLRIDFLGFINLRPDIDPPFRR